VGAVPDAVKMRPRRIDRRIASDQGIAIFKIEFLSQTEVFIFQVSPADYHGFEIDQKDFVVQTVPKTPDIASDSEFPDLQALYPQPQQVFSADPACVGVHQNPNTHAPLRRIGQQPEDTFPGRIVFDDVVRDQYFVFRLLNQINPTLERLRRIVDDSEMIGF
jgi:hypothetical protein